MDKNDEAARFRLQPNKRWTPPNAHHTIMTFIELFENQIKEDISKSKHYIKHKNLTNNELKALKELQKRDDIIIINADKGGAITILDTDL